MHSHLRSDISVTGAFGEFGSVTEREVPCYFPRSFLHLIFFKKHSVYSRSSYGGGLLSPTPEGWGIKDPRNEVLLRLVLISFAKKAEHAHSFCCCVSCVSLLFKIKCLRMPASYVLTSANQISEKKALHVVPNNLFP